MKEPLSIAALQEARAYAQANETALKAFFSGEVSDEDHFVIDPAQVAWFLELCKAISTVVGAGVSIATVCGTAMKGIQYAMARIKGKSETPDLILGLQERILIFAFEAYANSRQGVSAERLVGLTGKSSEEVKAELTRLEKIGVIRAAKDGSWKYRRIG